MDDNKTKRTNVVFYVVAYAILLSPLVLSYFAGYYFGHKAGVKEATPKIIKQLPCQPIKNLNLKQNDTNNKQPGNVLSVATPSKSYRGKVSYYTNRYCELYNPACKTASGEVFDDTKFTAACAQFLALGTRLRVSAGNNSVEVYCNDRGSFYESFGRILDLSKASFASLAPLSKGILTVDIEVL